MSNAGEPHKKIFRFKINYGVDLHFHQHLLTSKPYIMASTTESGIAKNLSNFKLVIDGCTAMGAAYIPSNTSLTVPNMTTLWTSATTAQTTIRNAEQNAKQPINAREILFAPLNGLVTKIISFLDSTNASKQVKADAKGIADKIRGFNARKPKGENGEVITEWVSQSQQSFVQKAEHFAGLIALLKTITDYTPGETALQTTALDNLYDDLKAANDGIGAILFTVINARKLRNRALYTEDTGMLDIAQKAKKYVKGAFGAKSAEFKSISGIRFKRPQNIDL